MNEKSLITQQYVIDAFRYDDGKLYWKSRPVQHFLDEWRQKIFNNRQSGLEAGTIVNGYRQVRFSFGKFAVHRIIFLMHHGYLPVVVDHINGDSMDNRIENLRAATHQQNSQNMKTPKSNTSGAKGVSLHKQTGKWAAGIRYNGKWKHLGLFVDIDSAIRCRMEAESEKYGEFANER